MLPVQSRGKREEDPRLRQPPPPRGLSHALTWLQGPRWGQAEVARVAGHIPFRERLPHLWGQRGSKETWAEKQEGLSGDAHLPQHKSPCAIFEEGEPVLLDEGPFHAGAGLPGPAAKPLVLRNSSQARP